MSRLNPKLRESIAAYIAEISVKAPPRGWLTTHDLERHLDLSQRSVSLIIARMVDASDVEVRKFRIKTGQVVRPVPHYKFTPRALKALGLDKQT